MHEHEVSGRPVQDRRAGERRRASRRRGSGPRPVRPAAAVVAVRPAEAQRPRPLQAIPLRRPSLRGPGMRTLARRPRTAPSAAGWRARGRRVLAGLAVMVVAGAVVVGLGLLTEAAAGARGGTDAAPASPGMIIVMVESERTAWDVARRVSPNSSGPELAALAERIVTDNSLTPVPLRPGQVLRVTSG
jgi:hypothetical protein